MKNEKSTYGFTISTNKKSILTVKKIQIVKRFTRFTILQLTRNGLTKDQNFFWRILRGRGCLALALTYAFVSFRAKCTLITSFSEFISVFKQPTSSFVFRCVIYVCHVESWIMIVYLTRQNFINTELQTKIIIIMMNFNWEFGWYWLLFKLLKLTAVKDNDRRLWIFTHEVQTTAMISFLINFSDFCFFVIITCGSYWM